MKKRGLVGCLAIGLLFGAAFSFINEPLVQVSAAKEVEADIPGVQVRSDQGDHYYIVVQDRSITAGGGAVAIGNTSAYNAPDYIRIYTDPIHSVMLSSIISDLGWDVNLWQSLGVMFPLTRETYETYNASAVYAVEILEGCTFPNNHSATVVNSKTVKFLNKNYGDAEGHFWESFDWEEEKPFDHDDEPIALTGAQVRGDQTSGLCYINFLSDAYLSATKTEYYALYRINAYSKIKVFLSEEDEGTYLAEITSLRNGIHNQFDNVPAFFFALSPEEYETYNGSTVYALEVEKGCELLVDGAIRTVSKPYRFVNQFSEGTDKYQAFDFSIEIMEMDDFGPVEIVGIHNRMDKISDHRFLMFLFEDNIFEKNEPNTNVASFVQRTNFLDSVLIYLTEDSEPLTLREIYDETAGEIMIRQFSETNMLGITILNTKGADGKYLYDGGHMFMIALAPGTQIPAMQGEFGYRSIQEKTVLYNEEYGRFGPNIETFDEYGNFRLYEEWNVNWSVVSCVATFTVIGIEGLSFPELNLRHGELVSLERFAQEGYDLTVTTEEGDKVYNAIIGANRNVHYILTYTPAVPKTDDEEAPAQKSGCGSAVGGSLLAILLASGIALAVSFRKKEGQR